MPTNNVPVSPRHRVSASPGYRRADWIAVVVAAVLPTLVTLAYFVLFAGDKSVVTLAIYGVGKAAQFALPVVWIFAVHRRKPTWTKPRVGALATGAAFGAAVTAAMLLLYYAWLKPVGYFDGPGGPREMVIQKIADFGITGLLLYAAVSLFYALVHSLLEEYYWRWFLFAELRRMSSFVVALVASNVAFAAHHFILLVVYFGWDSPATYLFTLAVATGGAFWTIVYHRTGSLAAVWLSHLLIDAGIFYIGYDLARGHLF